MSEALDLLNSLTDKDIAAYGAGRSEEPHILIDDDRYIIVPESLKRIAVQGDKDIETVTFDCPRYWDSHDLSKMKIYIFYECSDGYNDAPIAKNVRVSSTDSYIMHFDWTVSENVTKTAGKLKVSVCAKTVDADGNEKEVWNSEPCEDMYVSKGLNAIAKILEENPDLLTEVLLLNDNATALHNAAMTRSGVYVGSGEMPEWADVQIDPDGERYFEADTTIVHEKGDDRNAVMSQQAVTNELDTIESTLPKKILDPDNYPINDVSAVETRTSENVIVLEVGKLSRTDGAERDGEGGLRTPDFITVSVGEKIYPVYEELSSQGTFCFFLYDSSYNFISTAWFDGYNYAYVGTGESFTIPDNVGAAFLKGYISVEDTEGILTLKNNSTQTATRAEHKKIYIADHGYSIYGDNIDGETMHKIVIKADGKDGNSYNITEIKAPSDNPQEATIALMNWGNGRKQFVDFSSMTYDPDNPTVEIVCQTRGGEPLPEFSVRYNDGQGAGRVKKFTVEPDCIPIRLTSGGIEVRRNNKYDNNATKDELVTVNLADLHDGVSRNSKRISNLEKGLPDESFLTDSEVSYAKTVPQKALPYAEVGAVGGMTRKCTNLAKPQGGVKPNGFETVLNDDGSITLSGSAVSKVDTVIHLLDSSAEINMAANKTYKLTVYRNGSDAERQGCRIEYDDDIGGEVYGWNNQDITRPRKLVRVFIQFTPEISESPYNGTYTIMLNEGETALPYEPYFEGLRSAPVTEVESVGSNLIPFPYTESSKEKNGITYTVNADGSVHAKGTATSAINFYLWTEGSLLDLGVKDGETVSVSGEPGFAVYDVTENKGYRNTSFVVNANHVYRIRINFGEGSTIDTTFYPMLNKGSTALPYTPYVRNSLPIPEDVKALDGYGWGINESVFNYIDWEKKQFVKRVGCVDLGTLSWALNTGLDYTYYATIPNLEIPENISSRGEGILCSRYSITTNFDGASMDDKSMMRHPSGRCFIRDSSYEDSNTFKTSMSGVMLYYELAEPIITDISHLLTSDNLISVEGGGTVTMVNEHEYDVPSEITYMLKGE